MIKLFSHLLFILFYFFIAFTHVFAQSTGSDDYFNLSFQELANISVISGISRKEQSSFQSTSASYVITQDDIRRSGMTSLPDLFRMVPGMHVSQLNNNMWAINTRAPNTRFADELLVMIDGRSVFNGLFNGVYWNRVDTMLEDIERIEVIRGPGSSLWGSNASSGIINIVTKNASDTQGVLLNASGGTEQFNNEFSGRYGFSGDNHDSRIYLKQTRLLPGSHPPHAEQSKDIFTPGDTDYDGHSFLQTGFRSDIYLSTSQSLTIQGDYYLGEENEMRIPALKNTIDTTGHNFLLRYKNAYQENADVVLQVYFDYVEAEDDFFTDKRETIDIDFQHHVPVDNHNIIWGGGFRKIKNRTAHFGHSGNFALDPPKRTDRTTTLFIQDEITLIEDQLFLTIGSKFEDNDYTDHESQPNIKLGYQYDDNTFFWASLAKAISIPSRIVSDGYLDFNDFSSICSMLGFTDDPELGCIVNVSSSELKANTLYAKELGYRQIFNNNISIDNTLFYHDYRQNPGSTHRSDYLWGYEGIINYQPNPDWQLEASWTYHRGENDITNEEINNVPRHSGFLSSYYNVTDNIDLDLSYYYAGHTDNQDRYHRVDLRLAYRPVKSLELSLIATNLFDGKHTEGNVDSKRANTNIERAFIGKISYKFP